VRGLPSIGADGFGAEAKYGGFAHQEAHAVTKYKLRERGVTAATWDRDNVGYKIARDGRR
jgi:hypothetical protein